ncbi:MAG: 2-hydroxychromene-2-carboxylate isomerase [Rhizobiaceae bacterium]
MPATIDYFFISASPFAYLGHMAFHEIAARHNATIRYKPMKLGDVWANSGSVPLGQRTPTRQRYRRIELQRIAEQRGLPLNLDPKFFPADPTLADTCVIALVESGADPKGFLTRVHDAVWVNDRNIADAATIAELLGAEGHDAASIVEAAKSPGVAEIRDGNTAEAIAADSIGAPAYVLSGEPFWGQDRLDVLDRALASGRKPFKA